MALNISGAAIKPSRQTLCAFLCFFVCLSTCAFAQGHAPYAQLYYKVTGDTNDMLVAEIRPTITPQYTYFNALSWKDGYTGLQTTADGPGFIFSLWDPAGTEHRPAIRSLYAAPGARVDRFGGEGTGLHYLNTSAAWVANRWYRFVVRCWGSGDVTDYALWTQDEQTGLWTHHVTMETPEPHFRFNSFIVSFLEDWQGTPDKKRRTDYRGIKVRAVTGQWEAIDQANFTIYKEVTGHGPFERAVDAGIADGAWFLQSGGDTKPSLAIPTALVLRHPAEAFVSTSTQSGAAPKAAPLTIAQAIAVLKDRSVSIRWSVAAGGAPQFIYSVQLFDNPQAAGSPLVEQKFVAPDAVEAKLDLPSSPAKALFVRLTLVDIFDRQVTKMIPVTR
jgi:hypothetical protein